MELVILRDELEEDDSQFRVETGSYGWIDYRKERRTYIIPWMNSITFLSYTYTTGSTSNRIFLIVTATTNSL